MGMSNETGEPPDHDKGGLSGAGEHPGADDGDINRAIEHIAEAERDIAEGRGAAAEQQLKVAVHELEDAEHHKVFCIVINGRQKEVHKNHLTYEEVVLLAFPSPVTGTAPQFTVQYTRGPEKNPTGTLIEGQSVKIKDGMEFDVTQTNRS
jgi:hypothetical protein